MGRRGSKSLLPELLRIAHRRPMMLAGAIGSLPPPAFAAPASATTAGPARDPACPRSGRTTCCKSVPR